MIAYASPSNAHLLRRDLRAAVREAASDGFTFLQLQGKVVLEEPWKLRNVEPKAFTYADPFRNTTSWPKYCES